MNNLLVRLLPSTSAVPVWGRTGIRALEAHLQASSPTLLMDLAGLTTARLAPRTAGTR